MALQRLDALAPEHFDDLMRLYRGEWWSRERHPDDVRRMLDGTDEIIAFASDGRLVAFARVVTDYVYKALVFDVIVDPAQRGTGAGRMLVEALLEHPRLRDVEHLELYCRPEHVAFYAQWGFTAELGALHFMRRKRPS